MDTLKEEDLPGTKMEKLNEALKGKQSISAIRATVSEILNAKPADMKEFSHKINNHTWRGIIYQKRNSLMGTIVSLFDSKLFLVRGYPKIKYADDSRVKDQFCVAQEKVDGTNIGIFKLPDGTLMGKTRLVEHWFGNVYKNKNLTWKGLFELVDNGILAKKITRLLDDHDYVVYGELYGRLNPGEFVKYSVDIAFKVFDILDRRTQRFLPPEKVKALCETYELPMVKETWSGVLTEKEIQRIERELETELKEDGNEGWVAKAFLDNDVFFAKLKCEQVKELCWEVTAPTIPRGIIKKAIKKTLENFPTLKRIEDIEPYVLEELREEVEELLIKKSIEKIRDEIRFALTPSDESLYKVVYHEMMNMKASGIDLNDKRIVLPELVKVLGTINASKLYQVYKAVLREIGQQ